MLGIALVTLLLVAISTFIACLARITVEGRYTVGVLLTVLTAFAVMVGILAEFSRSSNYDAAAS